jgi:hypothetical protein
LLGRSGLRAITPFFNDRLTRASANLSSILTTTPRCFLLATGGAIGLGLSGGEIFSNVKAGIVRPLFVELKHSWSPPVCRANGLRDKPFGPICADGLIEAWIMPNCGAFRSAPPNLEARF